jgi:hypothetical protein
MHSPETQKIVVDFDDEKARRVMAEAARLARLAPGEWKLWIERSAAQLNMPRATLESLVVTILKDGERKARQAEAENRRIEQRAEKQRTAAERDEQRKTEREQWQIEKDAERKSKREVESVRRDHQVADRRTRGSSRRVGQASKKATASSRACGEG